MAETAVLIDGNSYAYRAFHALGGLSTSSGQPTGAVYGFASFLLGYLTDKRPTYLCIAFDAPGPTFRHEAFAEYKANRPGMPDELASQLPIIKEIASAWGIPIFEIPGLEADDILATLAVKAREKGVEVSIVTSDKDALQLVGDGITVTSAVKESLVYDRAEVERRFGVPPELVGDLLALMGDASDNVPGVPGVGEKTAAKLLRAAGSLERLLEDPTLAGSGKLAAKIADMAEQIRLSRQLVTLRLDAPVDFDPETFRTPPARNEKVAEIFQRLEFRRLLPQVLAEEDEGGYDYNGDASSLEAAEAAPRLAVAAAGPPERLRVALSWRKGRAAWFDVASMGEGDRRRLHALISDEKRGVCGHDVKSMMRLLESAGFAVGSIDFDTMIGAYLLAPGSSVANLQDIAGEYAGMRLPKGDDRRALCLQADAVLRAAESIGSALQQRGQMSLLRDLELPLIPILRRMEDVGIAVDLDVLGELAVELRRELERLESEIYELAGEEFNINSPKQLQVVLFEKLGLTPGKKTKTGYSTSTQVLAALAAEHLLPVRVLEYRAVSKLLSTYVEALPPLVGGDGRLHTTFNQAVTATGRLSSSDPNLQNIPIRSETGGRIRAAFVAGKGRLLISADYSQVELRILAQMSGDEELIRVFEEGGDVHTRTAVALYGVDERLVTSEMRRTAKMVNFCVIYGMSPYGLSTRLGVDRKTAEDFIKRYFQRYPGVKRYTEQVVEKARSQGYVETLLGRRRYLPDINSSDRVRRQAAEREAINMPVQGTAADMIKKAMILLDRRLREQGLKAQMLLQVHDELLLEAPKKEAEAAGELVRECMCKALKLQVPVAVDVGYGRSWLEAH